MAERKPEPLEYRTPDRTSRSLLPVAVFVIGLLGAPASIAVTWGFAQFCKNGLVGTALSSAAALAFAYFGQSQWKQDKLGRIGETLTVLWSAIFLVWSIIALIAFR